VRLLKANDGRGVKASSERSDPRAHLTQVFHAALGAVDGRACVARALRGERVKPPCWAIAIGKAAAAMMRGALEASGAVQEALAITKAGHCTDLPGVTCLEAGHPLPDRRSLAAGRALLAFLGRAPSSASFLFLISGGASALVECLPEGVTLADLARVNAWLLGSGLDIHAVNRIRRSLSLIKGGRLAHFLGGRDALNLLISDVPGDDPAVIGSGLLVPPTDPQSFEGLHVPPWLARLLALGAPPVSGSLENIRTRIVARPANARRAAADASRVLGYEVFEHGELLVGDAAAAGARLGSELREGSPGLHVWSAETTVRLPPRPGRGGRCQHLALSAALALRGCDGVVLLAAGTDGTDGPTEEAGAVVDGDTVARGEAAGLLAARSLEAADAGTFLAASGDLLRTGPTGTNVMDLILSLRTH
jgi:glycerate 2-kinase